MLTVSPYIILRGKAKPAIMFYQSVFGGELAITMQSEYNPDPAVADLVMHGQLTTDTFTLMVSDDPRSGEELPSGNIQICIWGDDLETARAWFTALSDGADVTTPFAPQMWGDHYGDLTDKFGVSWSVDAGTPS